MVPIIPKKMWNCHKMIVIIAKIKLKITPSG
jgi:hypothetical protein